MRFVTVIMFTRSSPALAFRMMFMPSSCPPPPKASFAPSDKPPIKPTGRNAKFKRKVSDEMIPRRAAVNAFGFGGINAHVLLEEWRPPRAGGVSPPSRHAPIQNTDSDESSPLRGLTPPAQKEAIPIAIVGIGTYIGPWSNRQDFQERVFRGRSVSDGLSQAGDQPHPPNH